MASSSVDRPHPKPSPERFAELVTPLLDSLVSIARRILQSDDLAWDAVQQALLTLWLEAELPPNPGAWLIRTVVNRCLHLSRTRAGRRKYEGLACRNHPEASDRDDPARKIENKDLLDWAYAALNKIESQQRAVLVLRVIEEMDYESIGLRLANPPGHRPVEVESFPQVP